MDILKLTSGLTSVFGTRSDDDFSDRLNYRYTVALLTFFAVILTTRQYSSEVIRCWVPAHFKSSYEAYVAQICWVQNTYFFPLDQAIPKAEIEREKNEIKYYQWVAFVLLIQALMFYFPRVFWNTFSSRCGLWIGDLIQAADKYKSASEFKKKGDYMDYMVKSIDQLLDDKRRNEKSKSKIIRTITTFFPCCGRFEGNYIIITYMATKIIYILNAIMQVYLVGGFLGESFWMFGFNFIKKLLEGHGWHVSNSEYFPKVTLCDFNIREIGHPNKSHRYTVQCVLPINLFNQQIFTAIWFWYLIVFVWNFTSLFIWFNKIVPIKAKLFIKRRTNLFNENVRLKLVPNRFDHFIREYLEADGIFIIRMIGNNTSDYVATDLIHQLWCQHHENYGTIWPNEPHQKINTCTFKHKNPELPKLNENNYFDQVRHVNRMISLDPRVNNREEHKTLFQNMSSTEFAKEDNEQA